MASAADARGGSRETIVASLDGTGEPVRLEDAVAALARAIPGKARPARPAPRRPRASDVQLRADLDAKWGPNGRAVARAIPGWDGCGAPDCSSGYLLDYDELGYSRSRRCRTCLPLTEGVTAYNLAGLPAAAAGWMLTRNSFDWDRIATTVVEGDSFRQWLWRWVRDWRPGARGILLQGGTGRGKTHLACGIVHALTLQKVARCRYAYWADFLRSVQATWSGEGPHERDVLAQILGCEVVVLDEMGAGPDGEWAAERAELLLEAAVNRRQTVIATTNLDLEGRRSLAARIGDRAWSRLLGCTTTVHIIGDDFRTTGGVR